MSLESKEIAYLKTPIGTAEIIGNDDGIISISVIEDKIESSKEIPKNLEKCVKQLEEYFQKKRKVFSLKLNPQGTYFQKKVWSELMEIPYGKTINYSQQAENIGNKKAVRAVASANGKNPFWIVGPCHRVIGKDGSLTGYSAGIWRKKWLLQFEDAVFKE